MENQELNELQERLEEINGVVNVCDWLGNLIESFDTVSETLGYVRENWDTLTDMNDFQIIVEKYQLDVYGLDDWVKDDDMTEEISKYIMAEC